MVICKIAQDFFIKNSECYLHMNVAPDILPVSCLRVNAQEALCSIATSIHEIVHVRSFLVRPARESYLEHDVPADIAEFSRFSPSQLLHSPYGAATETTF